MKPSDKTYVYEYDGNTITVTRRQIGTAYPRNGNAHNPTVYYTWVVSVDGESLGSAPTRWEAYEIARVHIDPTLSVRHWDSSRRRWVFGSIRNYRTVQAEMVEAAR